MGQPLFQHFCRLIEERGGDDYIFDQLSDGVSVRKLAKTFPNPKSGKPYSHSTLYVWLHKTEEREKRWRETRRVQSHSLLDDVDEILEDADGKVLLPADVSFMKEKIGWKKWLAEKYNRDDYGKPEESAQGVTLNFGSAFLDALMQKGNAHRLESNTVPEALPEPIDEAEFEVEPE